MEPSSEVAPSSQVDNRRQAVRKPTARSRVTNGRDLLPGIDGRGTVARRFHDIVAAILVDQGGIDHCSESRKQLIRRFAAAAVIAEQMEARLVSGEQINISEHALLCSSLVRLCQRIGISRVARDITASLAEIEAEPEPCEAAP
jgi:hypothetical protein